MMHHIEQLSPERIDELDLLPQAVIARPPSYFSRNAGLEFVAGTDDLDLYEIAAAIVSFASHPVRQVETAGWRMDISDGGSSLDLKMGAPASQPITIALQRHAGMPPGLTTLLLPVAIQQPDAIVAAINKVLSAFGLKADDLDWIRHDNPDL